MDYCGVHHDCVHQRVMAEGSRSERQKGEGGTEARVKWQGLFFLFPFSVDTVSHLKQRGKTIS